MEAFDTFDLASGLYWYAANYHSGQWSKLYSILSTLPYRPGAMECEPYGEGMEVYAALERGDLDADKVLEHVLESLKSE